MRVVGFVNVNIDDTLLEWTGEIVHAVVGCVCVSVMCVRKQ